MKYCETCGKELKNSEVFSVNGKIECESCAYQKTNVNLKEKEENIVNKQYTIQNISNTNKWAKILKIVGIIGIVFGIIASVIAGFVLIGQEGVLVGLAVIIGGTVASIISQALIMCFAELAKDASIIKNILINK